MAIRDKRRFDERVPVNSEPFIFTSGEVKAKDAGTDIVLKSFPEGDYMLAGTPVVEVITAFDGAATLDFGLGTIAADNVGEGGALTVVDADEFVKAADVTSATAGLYPAATSDAVAALGAGTCMLIQGVDATTPVITAALGGAPTVGSARIHIPLVKLPTAK